MADEQNASQKIAEVIGAITGAALDAAQNASRATNENKQAAAEARDATSVLHQQAESLNQVLANAISPAGGGVPQSGGAGQSGSPAGPQFGRDRYGYPRPPSPPVKPPPVHYDIDAEVVEEEEPGSWGKGMKNLATRLRQHRQMGWMPTLGKIAEDFGVGGIAGQATQGMFAGQMAAWGTQRLLGQVASGAMSVGAPFMTEGSQSAIGGMMQQSASSLGNIVGATVQGGMTAGPYGAAAGLTLGAAFEAAKLPKHIMDWSKALLDSQMQLAAFNGVIQSVRLEAERRQIIRDIESANATASRTDDLGQAFQELLDTIRPLKDTITNDLAMLLKHAVKAVDILVGTYAWVNEHMPYLTGLFGVISKIEQNTRKEQQAVGTQFENFLDYVRKPIPTTRVPPRK